MIEKERLIVDYLNDILSSTRNINAFVCNLDFHEFEKDIKSQYAVIRALEIIGEASKKIPNEIKEEYSTIPWKYMAGMRDKLIHNYFGVDAEVVWKTATQDIHSLEVEIEQVLSDLS